MILVFQSLGYMRCSSTALEEGQEKVAIYANHRDQWTHASWQAEDGSWWSKLGGLADITHSSVGALEGGIYGIVFAVMKRRRRPRRCLPDKPLY